MIGIWLIISCYFWNSLNTKVNIENLQECVCVCGSNDGELFMCLSNKTKRENDNDVKKELTQTTHIGL